jgi:hypothetical protein
MIGTRSEGAKGWSKELNLISLISWNDREPKYDIVSIHGEIQFFSPLGEKP